MIRVLHLISSFGLGGAEGNLARVVSHMDGSRFDNHVVVMRRLPAFRPELAAKQLRFQCLGMRPGVPDLFAICRLAHIIRTAHPDILQTWMYHADVLGLLIGRLTKVPIIAWNLRRSFIGMDEHAWSSRIMLRAAVRLSPLPNAVVTNSLAGMRTHQSLGYRPRHWVHIPNSFDVDRFRPDASARRALRSELGLTSNARVVGLVARFMPIKGHDNFASAAGILARHRPDVHFALVGWGIEPSNEPLVQSLRSSGAFERMHLMGERQDVQRVIAGFDVACSCSLSEGFPNAVGEALACGVPCVVTDVGDSALVVNGEGRVVAPDDPRAFAQACHELLELPAAQSRATGLRARKRIEAQYSIQSVVARYEELYEQLIGAPIRPKANLTGTA